MDQSDAEIQRLNKIGEKYIDLEIHIRLKRRHHEIMAYIEEVGITADESRSIPNFYAGERSGKPPLVLTVKFGRIDVMNSLIEKGFDPHTPYVITYDGKDRPIYLIAEACDAGKIDVIKSLVEDHHVDLKVTDSYGNTVVMAVLSNDSNEEEEKLEIVKYLVEKGADVTETPALAAAVSQNLFEATRYLISQGGLMGPKPPRFSSPLVCAAQEGNITMVKLLVEAGAKTDGLEGRTLFLVAVVNNNVDMVEYCNSLNIDLESESELGPAIKIAIESGADAVARYLVVDANISLERLGSENQTSFDLSSCPDDIIKMFVEAGFNPDKNTFKSTEDSDVFQSKLEVMDDVMAKRTLQDHCVYQVRKSLGKNANQKVPQLLLPTNLQKFVQLEHIQVPRNYYPSLMFITAYHRRCQVNYIIENYDSINERSISGAAPVQDDSE